MSRTLPSFECTPLQNVRKTDEIARVCYRCLCILKRSPMTLGTIAAANVVNNPTTMNTDMEPDSMLRHCYFPVANFSSILKMTFCNNSVDEFKGVMYKMQAVRQHIVSSILSAEAVKSEWIQILQHTHDLLTDSNTHNYQRQMLTSSGEPFSVNVKDEITGIAKDLNFLRKLEKLQHDRIASPLNHVFLEELLKDYHPVSDTRFLQEMEDCIEFLKSFVKSAVDQGRKPIMITDWDGTMKDYCSQYATNLQPIYSAVGMARFAERFTRLTAVLTAGPLRGPGILDLTALPIDGPVVFSGSWGREWWLGGRRVVHDDGITSEGNDALERINDEMHTLLKLGEYSQFGLVGSGVQRKVDRLTLGVQTVCKHVPPQLSTRYQDEVKERMQRVDPYKQILHFDPSTELEVEIVVANGGSVWNKANGVERLNKTVGETLNAPGRVLICGDTASDLPMVQYAAEANPQGVMAIFVDAKPELKERVSQLVDSPLRTCFVACPDIIHAAINHINRI